MPYQAMFIAHAMFSSDFDFEVNMGKSMKVYVKGADDDFVDWDVLPSCETAADGASCYCALTDTLTGLEYRSIQLQGAPSSVGCRMVERATDAQDRYAGSRGDPFYFDNWRQWIERLEYARDLYRLYNTR
jgi:hypothetical protein